MLKKILSISGKPGLYKLISQGKGMLIVESISADKKRLPAYTHEKIIALSDIAIYTTEAEVPLKEVFIAIQKKENGALVALDAKKATNDELRAFLAEVLPNYDRERVYPTDIRKMIQWYNLLTTHGLNAFEEEEQSDDSPKSEEA